MPFVPAYRSTTYTVSGPHYEVVIECKSPILSKQDYEERLFAIEVGLSEILARYE